MKYVKFRKHKTYDNYGTNHSKFAWSLNIGDIFKLTIKSNSNIEVHTYLVMDRTLWNEDPIDGIKFDPPVPAYCVMCLDDQRILTTPLQRQKNSFYELLA